MSAIAESLTSPAYEELPFVEPSDRLTSAVFKAASFLTDPVCKSHELYRRLWTVDALHPTAEKIVNFMRKFWLSVGIVFYAVLATATSLPAIGLRQLAISMQKEPFLYDRSESASKLLPEKKEFTLLSWNICCTGAGYSISDGGVAPWSWRIDPIIQKIAEKDADVNCLYETFDTKSAFYLCEKLKEKGYVHFYFNIGAKAVGVSSGIFIASKYDIAKPEFTPFPKESLVGRTKSAAKGVFAFDLQSQGKSFARIHATHLQHSEECAYPSPKEIDGRRQQMEIIAEKVKKVKDKCAIVTGDLNLDDDEYSASSWQSLFDKGQIEKPKRKTWGGDAFCAQIVQKRSSPPLNLDHTMILKDSAAKLETSFVDTGFDGTVFNADALSDHKGVFSAITVL